MSEELAQDHSAKIEDVAGEITYAAEGAYKFLLERREAALAAAIAPLHAERLALAVEYASIGEAAQNLEKLLPSTAREAQREADRLTVAGKHKEAQAKIKEAEEAASAPATMKARQQAISARIEAIADERQVIARRIFETWYAECQNVVRAAETGLFITLLDGLTASFYEYQERTGTGGTIDRPFSFLVKVGYIIGLTADERSAEWNSGSRWYGGRVRR